MKDENVASVVVNLTTLAHVWVQKGLDGKEQSLELDSAGRATTYNMSIDYDTWRVESGQLLLSSPKAPGEEKPAPTDTYEIMYLTPTALSSCMVILSPSLRDTTDQSANLQPK